MTAPMGDAVCVETTVIRTSGDWHRVVRSLRYDGERYTTDALRITAEHFGMTEQDTGLHALVGASS